MATSVTPIANGPLILEGSLEIVLADGSVTRRPKVALCRCGASEKKPFCDGRHAAIGFEAE